MGLLDRFKSKPAATDSDPRGIEIPDAKATVPEWATGAGYGRGPDWALDAFGGLQPLPCVSGVMHNQDVLAAVGGGVPFDAILAREPDNPYDANAIGVGVEIGGTQFAVGHIGRDLAAYLSPLLDARVEGGKASMSGVPGLVVGGPRSQSIELAPGVALVAGPEDDGGAYGVRLWLNHPEMLDALGLDLDRLTELTYRRFD